MRTFVRCFSDVITQDEGDLRCFRRATHSKFCWQHSTDCVKNKQLKKLNSLESLAILLGARSELDQIFRLKKQLAFN